MVFFSEKALRCLLDNGANANAADGDGITALIFAAQAGHTEIITLLLEKGASVSAANKDGTTALMEAAREGYIGIARLLIEKGARPFVALGFNRKEEAFFLREFEALGARVSVATVDGSLGEKGFVTSVLPEAYSYFYACGPEPMLKAVWRAAKSEGELSFEERMGCGFGACMGCSCKTIAGSKRICKDGPVLKKGEILW